MQQNKDRHETLRKTVLILFVFLLLFQVLDYRLTLIGIDRHGIDVEGNSFVRNVYNQGNIVWIGLFKVFNTVLLLFLLSYIINYEKRKDNIFLSYSFTLVMMFTTIFMGYVVSMWVWFLWG